MLKMEPLWEKMREKAEAEGALDMRSVEAKESHAFDLAVKNKW